MINMKSLSNEFKVGLTVIIATAVLILGIIWGKDIRIQINKYEIQVEFDKIGGMIAGDPVTVNGVKEGKVEKIQWRDRRVLCTLRLNDHVQLYKDATFTVVSAELLAGMKVEIDPGQSSETLNMAKQPFQGTYGGRIVDVGLVIGDLAKDIQVLTLKLDSTATMTNALLREGQLQQELKTSLQNINRLTEQLSGTPAQFQETLNLAHQLLT
ncbi:MAG: MCE family protein, partial [Caldithrix sp.]|nr:MCE family protein [Caldithrix sp.]